MGTVHVYSAHLIHTVPELQEREGEVNDLLERWNCLALYGIILNPVNVQLQNNVDHLQYLQEREKSRIEETFTVRVGVHLIHHVGRIEQ